MAPKVAPHKHDRSTSFTINLFIIIVSASNLSDNQG